MAIFATLIALTTAFAFNLPVKKDGKVVVRYHYESSSSSLTDMQNISNWTAEDPECGPSGSLPCAIDYDGNLTQFDAYLDAFTTSSQVVAAAIQKKD